MSPSADKSTSPKPVAQVTRRRKAKTGCRTCKIRKVKCDEGRPACQRCVSTGRVCDGYGIWGGGGNGYGTQERTFNTLAHQLSQPSHRLQILPGLSQQESQAFLFFRTRTVLKIAGVFGSDFWEQLVVQLSLREPAILHAVIALAATHRRGVIVGQVRRPFPNPDDEGITLDPNEKLALQQYNKAIGYLCHHLSQKDEQSMRITLASCAVFTCIELLKGDIETSQVHFRNGIRLLRDFASRSRLNTADLHISDAFTRISIRSSIFGQGPDMTTPGNNNRPGRIPPVFESMSEARRHLDWLLHDIHLLSAGADRLLPHGQIPYQLLEQQESLRVSSSAWLRTFSSSLPVIQSRHPQGNESVTFGDPLLRLYHGMASIMVATSLRRADEAVFDSYTSTFARMLKDSINLWNKVTVAMSQQSLQCAAVSHDISFTADMGFIPPLYYLALKCRVPRFRRLAVDFLVLTPHREGMWDGKMAAAVARRVIELEEGDFYTAMGVDLQAGREGESQALRVPENDLPLIPAESRINDVEVFLPEKGSTFDMKVSIACRRYTDGDWEIYKEDLRFSVHDGCSAAVSGC